MRPRSAANRGGKPSEWADDLVSSWRESVMADGSFWVKLGSLPKIERDASHFGDFPIRDALRHKLGWVKIPFLKCFPISSFNLLRRWEKLLHQPNGLILRAELDLAPAVFRGVKDELCHALNPSRLSTHFVDNFLIKVMV